MPTVRREILLPVERDRARELLTEPEELEGWLADEVEFSAEEGAPLRAAWAPRLRALSRAAAGCLA